MKNTIYLALKGSFYGEHSFVVVHALLGIRENTGSGILFNRSVKYSIGGTALFSKVCPDFSQGRRGRRFYNSPTI